MTTTKYLIITSLLVFGLAACDHNQAPAEKSGAKLGNVVQDAQEQLQKATETAGKKLEEAGKKLREAASKRS
jgi:hypothetical protein